MKYFNTAGPIKPDIHYYVSHRLNEKEINMLIEQQKYFIPIEYTSGICMVSK